MSYQPGDVVRLSASFAIDAVATDPSSVTFRIRRQYQTEVDHTYASGADPDGVIVKDSAGEYHVDYIPATDGLYLYRWQSTGSAQAVEDGSFRVYSVYEA